MDTSALQVELRPLDVAALEAVRAELLPHELWSNQPLAEVVRYLVWRAVGAPVDVARALAKTGGHPLAEPVARGVLEQYTPPTLASAGLTRSKR